MKKPILILLSAGILAGCTTQQAGKTSYMQQKPNEIYTTSALRSFLARNAKPRIVLRVSEGANKLSGNENRELVYNTIEKVFIANGFDVRDRNLFNQIIDNKDNAVNYESLYKRSDTDLIIEIMDSNPTVLYTTNKYVDNKTKEEKTGAEVMKMYGSSIEFKVIIIKSNQFAGSYKFNYTPCTEGCTYEPATLSLKDLRAKFRQQRNAPVTYDDATAIYDKEKYEDFIKISTQKLIDAMRKGQ